VLPKSLLGSDDDWIEVVRSTLFPILHPYLVKYTSSYGVGTFGEKSASLQFAGRVEVNEELLEEKLVEMGFRRNPVACYKSLHDGRQSEGSWVLLSGDEPEGFPPLAHNRQLHLTLFASPGGKGREMYAHNEIDWRKDAGGHLKAKNWKPALGGEQMRDLVDNYSDMERL
jgi:hypothetical protein